MFIEKLQQQKEKLADDSLEEKGLQNSSCQISLNIIREEKD